MPCAMSGFIQSVEVEGTVYVGGGGTNRGKDDYIVMAYDTQSYKWHTLPPYRAKTFALTAIYNKLVLVGGSHDGYAMDQLGVWQTDFKEWTCPFPPMLTRRSSPSVTSYKNWLVVAGGYRGRSLSTVEILDVDNKRWSTGPSTPIPWNSMKSSLIGDTWYLMGGRHDGSMVNDFYSVSLEALVSHSASGSSNIWRKLAHLNSLSSSPVNIGGSLLAVCGLDEENRKPVSTIQCYVPETNAWVLAGELPCALHNCTCIMTSDKVYVIGGYAGSHSLGFTYFSTF